MKSLGTASSNPRLGTPEHGEPQLPHGHEAGGGEAAPSDWRYWMNRAYRAWAAKQEQLSLFDEPLTYVPRRTQLRELPGETFEDIFQR